MPVTRDQPIRTRHQPEPLGRDPQDLDVGQRVRLARPEFGPQAYHNGQAGAVWGTSRYVPEPKGGSRMPQPPRLLVWVLFDRDAALGAHFADCLDRLP